MDATAACTLIAQPGPIDALREVATIQHDRERPAYEMSIRNQLTLYRSRKAAIHTSREDNVKISVILEIELQNDPVLLFYLRA